MPTNTTANSDDLHRANDDEDGRHDNGGAATATTHGHGRRLTSTLPTVIPLTTPTSMTMTISDAAEFRHD